MRALGKILGALVLAAVVVAAATPFLLKKFLPPERVKSIVVAQAQKALGREVRLAAVSYSLKGLSLDELAVSEKPDFQAGTFVSVQRFHVSAALLPLLKKTLVIDRVEAAGLQLTVIKNADGTYNFSDLVKASTAAAPSAGTPGPAAAPAQPLTFGVQTAAITGGRLAYQDKGTGDDVKVTDLEVKAKHIRLSGPIDADLALRVSGRFGGKPLDSAAAFAGKIDLGGQDPRKFKAELKKLRLEHDGFLVEGSLDAEGLEENVSKAELEVSRAGRELAELSWDGKARRAPSAAFGVELEGKLKARTQTLKAADLAAVGGPKMGQVPPLRASGSVSLKGSEASAKNFEVDTPVGRVTVDGGVKGLGTAELVPDAQADLSLDLPEIHASHLPEGILPKGASIPPVAVTGKARLKGDLAVFEKLLVRFKQGTIEVSGSAAGVRSGKPKADLEATVDLDLPAIAAADLPVATSLPKGFVTPPVAVKGKVRVKGEDAQVESLRVRGSGGTLDVSGSVKNLITAPEPALDVVAKLSLPALKAADAPFLPLPEGFALPPSRWDADLFASRDEARIKKLRFVVGGNDVEIENGRVSGLRSQKPVFDLTVKCRSFVLEELNDLTPAIHEMSLKGSGFFAVSVAGPLDKPVLGGKLQFKTLSALVAGLRLDGFTGTASFDEKRIDVPNLRGKVEDGTLHLDLTVKNYAVKPEVDLEAELSEFDLGKVLAAKTTLAEKSQARAEQKAAKAQAAGAPKPAAAAPKAATPMNLKGKLTVAKLMHPNFTANGLRSSWSLIDYTPDYQKLSGSAKFDVPGGGSLRDLGTAATKSKLARVVLAIFTKADDASYTELVGDYSINAGLLRVVDSHMNANIGTFSVEGTADLPTERLDLIAHPRVQGIPDVDLEVKGTFSEPKGRALVGKAIEKTVEKAVQDAGKKLLEGLLKKR